MYTPRTTPQLPTPPATPPPLATVDPRQLYDLGVVEPRDVRALVDGALQDPDVERLKGNYPVAYPEPRPGGGLDGGPL